MGDHEKKRKNRGGKKGMNKIEEISFLKLLQGKTGKYSDNPIVINCGLFSKKEEKDRYLNSRITIRPKGMNNEKKTMDVLKELMEKSKVARIIEDDIVEAIEEGITKRIRELQEEMRDILGLDNKEKIAQDGQDNQMMGGDTR